MSVNLETPASPETPTRDEKGRFVRGNPGGPGNPFARQTALLRAALLARADAEKIGKIADKMIELAQEGDVSAARLIFTFCIGKPTGAVDPDEVDALEVEHYKKNGMRPEELTAINNAVPAAFVAPALRTLVRAREQSFENVIQDSLQRKAAGQDPRSATQDAIRTQLEREGVFQPVMEEDEDPVTPCDVNLPAGSVLRVPASTVTKPGATARRAANPSQPETPPAPSPRPNPDARRSNVTDGRQTGH